MSSDRLESDGADGAQGTGNQQQQLQPRRVAEQPQQQPRDEQQQFECQCDDGRGDETTQNGGFESVCRDAASLTFSRQDAGENRFQELFHHHYHHRRCRRSS